MSKSSTRREDIKAVDSMEMSPFSFNVGCDFNFRLFGLDPRMLLNSTRKQYEVKTQEYEGQSACF